MSATFSIALRGEPFGDPLPNGAHHLIDENTTYLLKFESTNQSILSDLKRSGAKEITPGLWSLRVHNFIGRLRIGQVHLDVRSTKIDRAGVSALLEEVTKAGSALTFSWKSPTAISAAGRSDEYPSIPYHQLQKLVFEINHAPVGTRTGDQLAQAAFNATRRFQQERPLTRISKVQKLDARALYTLIRQPRHLVPVASGSLQKNPLAVAFSKGGRASLPLLVRAPKGKLSYDTAENRFVKHALHDWLTLLRRFSNDARLHEAMREECASGATVLEESLRTPAFLEASAIQTLQPSQALLKTEGYRQIHTLWLDILRSASHLPTSDELTDFLEGRNIATLYEYWTFIRIVRIAQDILGLREDQFVNTTTTDITQSLRAQVACRIGDTRIYYNPTYGKSEHGSYSTPLRPDVVIEHKRALFAFDAKYRIDSFNLEATEDTDDEEQEEITNSRKSRYKRADLYKMHTYRDAISRMEAAFAVYPGTEFTFFQTDGKRITDPELIEQTDGVGAIPLRPGSENADAQLRAVISRILC